MNRAYYDILYNKPLTKDIYEMKLEGDTSHITAPGQFLNILLEGFYINLLACSLYSVQHGYASFISAMASGRVNAPSYSALPIC